MKDRKIMIKKKYIWLLTLFLFSFGLRLYFIQPGLSHYDSVVSAIALEDTIETGKLTGTVNQRYGFIITNLVLFTPLNLLNLNLQTDSFLSLSGIIFGSLSTIILFLFTKKLFNNTLTAIFTSLLYSVCPVVLSISTTAKEHGMSTFFVLLSFYFIFKAEESKNNQTTWRIISTLIFVYSISIRESNLVLTPLFFLWVLYVRHNKNKKTKKRKCIKSFLIKEIKAITPHITIFSVSLSILLYTYLFKIIINSTGEIKTGAVKFLGFYSPIFFSAINDLIFTSSIAVFIISLISANLLFKENKKFLATTLLIWFFYLFLYFGNTSGYTSRHLEIVVIPLFVLTGSFLSRLYEKNKIISIAILLILLIALFVPIYPLLKYRKEHNISLILEEQIKNNTETDAIIVAGDNAVFIDYYAHRSGTSIPIFTDQESIIKYILELKKAIKDNKNIYITKSGLFYDNRLYNSSVSKIIKLNFEITPIAEFELEDFHHKTLKFTKYNEILYKITKKNKSIDQDINYEDYIILKGKD